MKITEIKIENFKGIKYLHIKGLGDVNVFIGKNSSGKSSILEAITSFFSRSYFLNNLNVPPQWLHYDKDGVVYRDMKISITFEFHKNEYKEFGEQNSLSENDIKFLEEKYGQDIIVTKKNLNQEGSNYVSEIKKIYIVESGTVETQGDKEKFDNLILLMITKHYSGGEKIRFVSSIDGFRSHVDMQEYYDAYYARGGNSNQNLRGPMDKIFQKLGTLKNSSKERHHEEEFIDKLNKFSPSEFPRLFTKTSGEIPVREFGEKGNTEFIPLYDEGDGFIDSMQLLWEYSTKSFSGYENKCIMYIIDEPENHKHASLQRKIFNMMIALSKEGKQFFICTHSSTFTSRYGDCSVYLVTKSSDSDENGIKQILDPEAGRRLRRELGLLNIDNFFSNAILFVEGATESVVVPALLRFYGEDASSLGMKIHDVGGNAKINMERLEETLMLLKDTSIVPFIVLDNDKDAGKHQEAILKKHSDLFVDKLQYCLWDSSLVDGLPTAIVSSAFNKWLKDKKSKRALLLKDLIKSRKDGHRDEDFLGNFYHETFKSEMNKPTLGFYIADEIDRISNTKVVREALEKNQVFSQIKKVIESVRSISES